MSNEGYLEGFFSRTHVITSVAEYLTTFFWRLKSNVIKILMYSLLNVLLDCVVRWRYVGISLNCPTYERNKIIDNLHVNNDQHSALLTISINFLIVELIRYILNIVFHISWSWGFSILNKGLCLSTDYFVNGLFFI